MRDRARRDRGALDRVARLQHPQETIADLWQDLTDDICREVGRREVGCVSHSYDDGLVLEVVPWPNSEPTSTFIANRFTNGEKAVRRKALELGRPPRPKRVPIPFYQGAFGDILAKQPKSHRKRWSDHQWASYHDYADESRREYEEARRGRAWARPIVIKREDDGLGKSKLHPMRALSAAAREKLSKAHRKSWKLRKEREEKAREEKALADFARREAHERSLRQLEASAPFGDSEYDPRDPRVISVFEPEPEPPPGPSKAVVLVVMCKKWHTIDTAYLDFRPRFRRQLTGPQKETLWLVRTNEETSVLVCPMCGEWLIWRGGKAQVAVFAHDPGCVRSYL